MVGFSQNQRSFDGTIRAAQNNIDAPGSGRGKLVVLGVLSVAVALGVFAVWFQWGQTRRCLDFFGPEVASRIQSAPVVELWALEAHGDRVSGTTRLDVSQAPGLVHLRRGLIEDVNYIWDSGSLGGQALPAGAWDVGLVFLTPGGNAGPAVVLAIDLDKPGHLTVVGRPGRVCLGPLLAGLAKWVKATQAGWNSGQKSGY